MFVSFSDEVKYVGQERKVDIGHDKSPFLPQALYVCTSQIKSYVCVCVLLKAMCVASSSG